MPRQGSSLPTRLSLCTLALCLLPAVVPAQVGLPASSLNTSSNGAPVNGQVINAINGAPVFRALVQSDAHSQLTDHEGRFSFPASPGDSPTLRIYKPGYYSTPEGEQTLSLNITPTQTSSVTARLYPESFITGILTASDGGPLQDVIVTAERCLYGDSGRQWMPLPPKTTNSRGEFRLAVPAGDYRLQIGIARRMQSSGQLSIPQVYPSTNSTDGSNTFHLASGAEERVDLHAEVSPMFPVPVRIEPSSEDGFASMTALTDTGARIPVNNTHGPSGSPMAIELPRGTFTVIASRDRGDQIEMAEVRVEVNGPSTNPLIFRLTPVPSIPVVINVDRATSTSDKTPPTLPQLGLTLSSLSGSGIGPGRGGFTRGSLSSRDTTASLRPMPGTYQLVSQARGSWHIQAATYGSTDLLQHDLVVALASGSAPIVLTVSDQSGSLSGNASLNGSPQSLWVYLIPSYPSAVPFYSVRSSPAGVFALGNLPPGSYQALAFELHRQVDLHSPAVLAPYSTYIRNVTVAAGEKASLELDAVPASAVLP